MSIKPGKIVISGPMCKPRFKPSDFLSISSIINDVADFPKIFLWGKNQRRSVSLKFGGSNQTTKHEAGDVGHDLKFILKYHLVN